MTRHALFLALPLTFAVTLSATTTCLAADTLPRVDPAYPAYQPPYPASAQTNGEQGSVVVDVLVRPSGKPTQVKIDQSSGYPDLDIAAEQGVLNWHFIPGTHDGDTVSAWATVKVVFNLPTMVPAPASPPAN